MSPIARFFRFDERGTSLAVELRAGMVTFLTMSYILFVNPQILSEAGLPVADVAVATALATGIATLTMAFATNYPIALAPGMGLNAFFTYGVVRGLGIDWQVALAAVFVEGLIFLVLAVTGVRSGLLRAIPASLKLAITAGIGAFLVMIGLQSSGLVVAHPSTLLTLGDVRAPGPLLTLAGVLLIAALMATRARGAILMGIGAIALTAWAIGEARPPEQIFALPALPRETLFALDFEGLLTGSAISVVLAFLFVDLFDTAGTLVGVARAAELLDENGDLPRADRAFAADATGTMVGAALGTSTVTSYIESATGVEEGGRTGFTAVVVAGCFFLSLFVTPLVVSIPAVATAPALIVTGALMMRGLAALDVRRLEDAIPAFLTVLAMPFTYSIATGISLGIVTWVGIRALAGRPREVPPGLALVAILLVAYYGFLAGG